MKQLLEIMNEIEIYANFKLGDGYVNFNGFIGKFILLVLDFFLLNREKNLMILCLIAFAFISLF